MNGLSLLNLFGLISMEYFFDLNENHHNIHAIMIGVIGMPLANFICLNTYVRNVLNWGEIRSTGDIGWGGGDALFTFNLIVCIFSAFIFFDTLNNGLKNTEDTNLVIFFNAIICFITLTKIVLRKIETSVKK